MPQRSQTRRAAPSGETLSGFNFTTQMRAVCADMATRLTQLRHVDMQRIAVSFSQARRRVSYGLHATLTPMRFKNGERVGLRRGRKYTTQQLLDRRGREYLYILSFYLPRFMDTPFREKLVTIIHELWHISPDFDGDIRRHSGRCFAHTHSQKEYDQQMGEFADQWLALSPPEPLYDFLRLDFNQLHRQHGGVFGVKIPQPKLIPVDEVV